MPDASHMPNVSNHSDPSEPSNSPDATAASAGPNHATEEPPVAGHAPSQPPSSADEPAQPPEHEVEGAVPPGYDWPTHGGYLGCLVGTLAACPIVGFIAANIWSLFRLSWLAFPLFALLIAVSLVAIVGAGRLGWRLGKRFYRYYPQPRPTWGESDEAIEAQAIEAQAIEAQAIEAQAIEAQAIEAGAAPPQTAAAGDEATSDGALDEDTTDDHRAEIATTPDDAHG